LGLKIYTILLDKPLKPVKPLGFKIKKGFLLKEGKLCNSEANIL